MTFAQMSIFQALSRSRYKQTIEQLDENLIGQVLYRAIFVFIVN